MHSFKDVLNSRASIPELGLSLILTLAVVTAVTVAAAICLMLGQVVPLWVTGFLMVAVVVGAVSMPALNRRTRANRASPVWGRTFSKVAVGSAVVIPLVALFPAAMDPDSGAVVLTVIAVGEVVLLIAVIIISGKTQVAQE